VRPHLDQIPDVSYQLASQSHSLSHIFQTGFPGLHFDRDGDAVEDIARHIA
jgi:hypothetical protein